MYKPQEGDRVRRTFKDGTVMEGVIARVEAGWAQSEGCLNLYNSSHPEQTVLLDRPFKLNTELCAVYGHPTKFSYRVVRLGPDDAIPWLGDTGSGRHWYSHKEVERLVRDEGWVEYNLDGSRKND